METFSADAAKAYAVLELSRRVVGVKFAYDRAEFDRFSAVELTAGLAYCVMVKCAMGGASLKMTRETSGCGGSSRAFGFVPPTESYYDGGAYCALGLYRNADIAKNVVRCMTLLRRTPYGVIAKPLELFEERPDVVIMTADTREGMRVVQGYTWMYGAQPAFRMTGNQAICVECTCFPIETGAINVSLFCSGTRHLAGWRKDEIAIGMPFSLFPGVIEGVRQTVNAVEMNDRKRVIEEKLRALGMDDMNIEYDRTYYTDLETRKKSRNPRGAR